MHIFFLLIFYRDPNENSNKGISTPSNLQKVDIIKSMFFFFFLNCTYLDKTNDIFIIE